MKNPTVLADPATESAGSTTPTPPVTPAMVTDPPPAASDQQEPPAKDAEKLGEPGKAALNAERKARRDAEKALAAMQAKVAEFEQRDMSEAEKQAAKLTQLQQENARLQADMLKAQVAAAKGVPADLLAGTTEDELNAAADRLLAFKGEQPPADFGAGQRGQRIDPLQDMQRQYDEAVTAGNVALQVTLKRRMSALQTTQ